MLPVPAGGFGSDLDRVEVAGDHLVGELAHQIHQTHRVGLAVDIQQIAVAVLQPDPAFIPLTFAAPIVLTLLGVLGAAIVYAVQSSKQPARQPQATTNGE